MLLDNQIFCLFFLLIFCPAFSDDLPHILALMNGVQNPSATVFNTWNPTTNKLCNFTGITCHPDGSVQVIELSNQYLSGEVPFDSICQLKSLEKLSLGMNSLVGPITEDLKKCVNLKYLDLGNNLFNGTVPDLSPLNQLTTLHLNNSGFSGLFPWKSLSNMSGLVVFSIGDNPFDRMPFPEVVLPLKKLTWLYMSNCSIEGSIPPGIGNLTNLENLELSDNYLEGRIPMEITKLKNLSMLMLFGNSLTGRLPIGLGNLSRLEFFDASINDLNGGLSEVRNLTNLVSLQLFTNGFTGVIPPELDNFRRLVNLSLYENYLTGEIPQKLGYWSEFNFIDVTDNHLTGPIPPNMCRNGMMKKLLVLRNKLTGGIPATYAKCKSLNRLRVQNNSLSGEIPNGIWGLPNVHIIDLALNEFVGSIPDEIGKAESLTILHVHNNRFSGGIPSLIGNVSTLEEIDLSNNQFSGGIPATIWDMNKLSKLRLQNNKISDSIPESISSCVALSDIDMANNSISGEIPFSLGSLPSLYWLNLSGNQLTGPIPSSFLSLELSGLDLSNNQLSGSIPDSLTSEAYNGSFAGNKGLCSEKIAGFRPCSWKMGNLENPKRLIVILSVASFLGFFLLGITCHSCIRNKKPLQDDGEDSWNVESFHILSFEKHEILSSIKPENHIGKGGFGNVYKVSLSTGKDLAVKHILDSRPENSTTSGIVDVARQQSAEVEMLSTIRHVNVVKLYCSIRSGTSNYLLYEYMPNGSLWDRLHGSQKMPLNWETRFEIAIGSAKGLEYLHHGCNHPIIHRDIKSSNILLDEFLKPRIADFGLAKILEHANHGTHDSTQIIAGTHGYIAPEYGYGRKVNEKSDIYSFGVVLMELVTGKKPIEPQYEEKDNIVLWVHEKVRSREGTLSIIDSTIESYYREEALNVLRIAMDCTSSSPWMRPTMKSVVQNLELSKCCRMSTFVIGSESK